MNSVPRRPLHAVRPVDSADLADGQWDTCILNHMSASGMQRDKVREWILLYIQASV